MPNNIFGGFPISISHANDYFWHAIESPPPDHSNFMVLSSHINFVATISFPRHIFPKAHKCHDKTSKLAQLNLVMKFAPKGFQCMH